MTVVEDELGVKLWHPSGQYWWLWEEDSGDEGGLVSRRFGGDHGSLSGELRGRSWWSGESKNGVNGGRRGKRWDVVIALTVLSWDDGENVGSG
ncbi:hypothetical protein L1987_15573 [Smallanthus sonchifolius]|uniref:Uncharacterized protein n=1 Tax=Smallanthus sonchifolius TaxID=185202 RepID=A0ACB9J824_9ASTR|nr:hypothetical protein L1987_15573 [Smallanthus sonchifolius]